MPYKQISFITTGKDAHQLSEYLTALDALAVTLKDAGDQPIFEPDENQQLWQATVVTGLFDEHMNHENLLEHLMRAYPDGAVPDYTIHELADEEWETTWMAYYEPLQFGKSLWVVPSWCEVKDPNATNLILDPGLAFGTGSHETTSLCLKYLAAHPPEGLSVVDYGCGSGILGIAALKLGAVKAVGVDISDQAIEASRHNCQLNGISEEQFVLGKQVEGDERYELVIANILANPLLILAEQLAALCSDKILLSGILEHQVELIIQKYKTWFRNFDVEIDGEWARVVGEV